MTEPTVLVVEDEPDIAELYAGFLEEEYTVKVATTAAEAHDRVDSAVDAVLLDRRLPDGSGDEVLDRIREQELGCRVAMVTAVEPDFDILDMGFDLYLTKPVSYDRLHTAVETLLARTEYDDHLQRAAALASKRAVLEAEKTPTQLDGNDAYAELLDELAAVDDDLAELTETFSPDDYRAMFRDLGRA